MPIEPPDKVYLQIDEGNYETDLPGDLGVTWCPERIYKSDIEYVRAEKQENENAD